jgi:hypothetical protein
MASLHRAEISSLEEHLGIASNETETQFDQETNEALEQRALELLEERRQANVRRHANKN